MRVNALTGVLAQQSLDGTVTPAVFTPDRRWSPDAPGLRVLTDLLGHPRRQQGDQPASALSDLAGSATDGRRRRTTREQAQAQELSADYLDRISGSRADVASLRQTLASTPQTSRPQPGARSAGRRAGRRRVDRLPHRSGGRRGEPGDGRGDHRGPPHRGGDLLGRQLLHPGVVDIAAGADRAEQPALRRAGPGADQRRRTGRADRHRPGDPGGPGRPLAAGAGSPPRSPGPDSSRSSAQLVGADGVAWGPPVQLSVESTAYGALTVIIIVVAGGVLVLMVALRIVQRLARTSRDTAPRADHQPTIGPRPGRTTGSTPSRTPSDRPDLRDVIPDRDRRRHDRPIDRTDRPPSRSAPDRSRTTPGSTTPHTGQHRQAGRRRRRDEDRPHRRGGPGRRGDGRRDPGQPAHRVPVQGGAARRARRRRRQRRVHAGQHPAEHHLRAADRRRADLGGDPAAVQGPVRSRRRRAATPSG